MSGPVDRDAEMQVKGWKRKPVENWAVVTRVKGVIPLPGRLVLGVWPWPRRSGPKHGPGPGGTSEAEFPPI